MDHSAHEGHSMPGMDDDNEMCSMAMLFTWNYKNTCVVSSKWHIKTVTGMVFSCLAIALLSYLYEFFKYRANVYKAKNRLNKLAVISQPNASKSTSLMSFQKDRQVQMKESVIYGFQIFYSFMLMLVFMTYNGWLMISLVVGAIIGHFHWTSVESRNCTVNGDTVGSLLSSEEIEESGMACH